MATLLLAFITLVVVVISTVNCEPAVVLPLRPAFPTCYPVQVQQLKARDQIRHGRVFKHNISGLVNISVVHNMFFSHTGYYVTKVMLGSPPREFELLFDTGSDVTWTPCRSCVGCPWSVDGVPITAYDRGRSWTAGTIGCSHQLCNIGLCSRQTNSHTNN